MRGFGSALLDLKKVIETGEAGVSYCSTKESYSNEKTVDELRNQIYHHSKAVDFNTLPLASYSLNAHIHIRRAYFVSIQMMSLLSSNEESFDPLI